MKRALPLFAWTLLVVVLTVLTVEVVRTGGIAAPLRYELPDRYRGWVLVQYGKADCPALRVDGLFQVLTVGADGTCDRRRSPRLLTLEPA